MLGLSVVTQLYRLIIHTVLQYDLITITEAESNNKQHLKGNQPEFLSFGLKHKV